MASGSLSKMVIFDEVTFGVYDAGKFANAKRVEIADDSMKEDFGFKTPGSIQGNRIAPDAIKTQLKANGGISVVAGPENGFANLLRLACGKVVTFAGEFKREFQTGKTGTTLTLAKTDLTTGSVRVYKKADTGASAKYVKLTAATDYTVDLETGIVTLVSAAIASDKFMICYCFESTGVYSHIITADSLSSFQYWNLRAGIALFEATGCKVDKFAVSLNASDFLSAKVDIVNSKLLSETDNTGHTFPENALLSALDPFTFDQAICKLDNVDEVNLEKIDIEISNKLEARYAIRGTNTAKSITPAEQEMTLKLELEFDNMTYYNKFKQSTWSALEIIYGAANGVTIGTSSSKYQFQIYLPKFRFESADLPSKPGTMLITSQGKAGMEKGMNEAYEFVIVNGETAI